MSDAALTALITGAVTLTGVVLTSYIAYLNAKKQADVTLATAARTQEAENERLYTQRTEEELRVRRAAYLGYLILLERFDTMMRRGRTLTHDDLQEWFAEYDHRANEVLLVGTDAIQDQFDRVGWALRALGIPYTLGLEDDVAMSEQLRRHYREQGDPMADIVTELGAAMRADLRN
jgi:hypothetical protein